MRKLLVYASISIGVLTMIKCLASISMTPLWADELATAYKSFQPSISHALNYLKADVHPPFYYVLVWVFGKFFGETAVALRLFSWLTYASSCLVISLAAWSYKKSSEAAIIAFLLASCLPISVRFSIEGKSYALMLLLTSLLLAFRSRSICQGIAPPKYAFILICSALGLTHYYGFAFLLLQAFWDKRNGFTKLFRLECLGLVVPSSWLALNLGFLLGNSGREWLEPTSPSLVVMVFKEFFGPHWHAHAVLLAILIYSSVFRSLSKDWFSKRVVFAFGLDTSAALVLITLVISAIRPSSYPRYYICILPSVICFLSTLLAPVACHTGPSWRTLGRASRNLPLAMALVIALYYWEVSFELIHPDSFAAQRGHGSIYQGISLFASGSHYKLIATDYCPPGRSYLYDKEYLITSDKISIRSGLIQDPSAWHCVDNEQALILKLGMVKLARDSFIMVALRSTIVASPEDYIELVQSVKERLEARGCACIQNSFELPATNEHFVALKCQAKLT